MNGSIVSGPDRIIVKPVRPLADVRHRPNAKAQLFDDLEVFYNQRRRQSAVDRMRPAAFERRMTQAAVTKPSTESDHAHSGTPFGPKM
jgi:hypothetical protein